MGRKELRILLKWWKELHDEFFKKEKEAEEIEENEVEENKDNEVDEDEEIQKQISELQVSNVFILK